MVMAEKIYPMGAKQTQLGEKINNNNNYNNNYNNNHPLIAKRKRKRLSAVLDKLHVHNNNVTHYTNNNHQDEVNYNIKLADDLFLKSTPDRPEYMFSRTTNLEYQIQIKSEAIPNAKDLYFPMISQNAFYLNTQNLDETTNSVLNLIQNPQVKRKEPLIYYPAPQEYPLDLSMKSLSRFQETQLNLMHVSIKKKGVASNKTKESMATRYKINVSPVIEEVLPGSSSSDLVYICPICEQMFSLHDRLAKHIASRHKTKNSGSEILKSYVCDVCNRSFARSDMLTRHFRLHSGSKPYNCNSCGQVFSRSDHLSTHKRTHSGEKPYRCSICSYAACRRDMITRHMRTHLRKENLKNGETVDQKRIVQLNIPSQLKIEQNYEPKVDIRINSKSLADNNNSIIFTKTET